MPACPACRCAGSSARPDPRPGFFALYRSRAPSRGLQERPMRTLQLVLASLFLSLAQAQIASAETKLTVGVALPRAQLGQPNGANADVAEPVRQVLMSYLKGPVIEVVTLDARIPVQIAAEAKEKGCAFVLYTDVSQASKGGGLKMLKKLAPVAGMLPVVG